MFLLLFLLASRLFDYRSPKTRYTWRGAKSSVPPSRLPPHGVTAIVRKATTYYINTQITYVARSLRNLATSKASAYSHQHTHIPKFLSAFSILRKRTCMHDRQRFCFPGVPPCIPLLYDALPLWPPLHHHIPNDACFYLI